MGAREIAADEDLEAGTGAPARLLGELQDHPVEPDGVIAGHGPGFLVTEDFGQIGVEQRDEGNGGVGGGAAELSVEGGQEAVAQVAVGGRQGADAGDAEFVDQAVLEGAIDALTAPAGLGGIAEDVLDAELLEGPADLGELATVGAAARGGGMAGPAGAVRVEGRGEAVGLEDGTEGLGEGLTRRPS